MKLVLLPKYGLLLLALFAISWASEDLDTTAPVRLAKVVRSSDCFVSIIGGDSNRTEKKITDPKVIDSIAEVFARASCRPTLHGFSINPGLFTFYSKGKMVLHVSIEPGNIVRVNDLDAEENLVVEKATIDALLKIHEATK